MALGGSFALIGHRWQLIRAQTGDVCRSDCGCLQVATAHGQDGLDVFGALSRDRAVWVALGTQIIVIYHQDEAYLRFDVF